MDIGEIRKERRRLELIITTFISDSIKEFTDITGVGIENIDVPMIEVTTMGDDRRKYTMGQVKVELERI